MSHMIKSSNETFSSKIESVQYNAALVITIAIRDSSREKLYQGIGLEHLQHNGWMRRLCLFYKVLLNKVPKYIYEIIPPIRHSFRNPNLLFTAFPWRTEYYASFKVRKFELLFYKIKLECR